MLEEIFRTDDYGDNDATAAAILWSSMDKNRDSE